MTFDPSTIIYLVLLVFVTGLVVTLGRLFVSFVLVGLSTLAVIFALLLLADFITGGTALGQIANALTPLVATVVATIAAWLRMRGLKIKPGRYELGG